MTDFERKREDRIKLTGLPLRLKAEANLERQRTSSFREVQNTSTGEIESYKSGVADIYVAKGTHRSPRKSFTVPLIPGFTDK